MKKRLLLLCLTILVFGVGSLTFNLQEVQAQGTVTISSDGNITPSYAPILKVDNSFFMLINDLNNPLIIEKDDIILSGTGRVLSGGSSSETGIILEGRNNVTIMNMTIQNFGNGINISSCSNIRIIGNVISDNERGIILSGSTACEIYGNVLVYNELGIHLTGATTNQIHANNFSLNGAYDLSISSANLNNRFYTNDFLSTYSINGSGLLEASNMWDNGYPIGGNHWGTKYYLEDNFQGPLQDQPGSDGIGDTPVHLVIGQIFDNYPRIEPCSNVVINYPDTPEVSNIPTTITCTVNKPEFQKDSTIKIIIEGKISPSASGVTVNITMYNTDQNLGLIRLSVQTDSEGRYYYEELPNREEGTYNVRASWEGNSMYLGAESDETSFKIVEEFIPGSPWESILMGGILGFGAIYLLRKKKISV